MFTIEPARKSVNDLIQQINWKMDLSRYINFTRINLDLKARNLLVKREFIVRFRKKRNGYYEQRI